MANTRPNKNIPSEQENPLFHDTWKLLKNYRDAVWNLELAVQQVRSTFEIEYGSSIEEFLDSIYLAGADIGGTRLEDYARSIERSNKMLTLLNSAVDILRNIQGGHVLGHGPGSDGRAGNPARRARLHRQAV